MKLPIGTSRQFIAALLAMVAGATCQTTLARDVYVDAVLGDNASGNGSQSNPWKTVTFALTRAHDVSDKIHIAPGLYDSALGEAASLVLPSGVSLVGVDRQATRIETKIQLQNPPIAPRMRKITVTGLEVTIDGISTGLILEDCLIDLDYDWARFEVLNGGEFSPFVIDTRFQGRAIFVVVIEATNGATFGGEWRDGFFYLGLDGAHIVKVDLSAGSRMTTRFVGTIFEAKQHEGLAFWFGYSNYLPRNVSEPLFINNTFMIEAFHFSQGMDHHLTVVNNILYKPTDFWLVDVSQVWNNLLFQSQYFVGQNGNIDADPMFRDARFDFRPALGSPAIDHGLDPIPYLDPLDRNDVPRILDGNLDLVQRVDLGAYEFSFTDLEVGGDPRPGGLVEYNAQGAAPFVGMLLIGLREVEWPIRNLGVILVDPAPFGQIIRLGILPARWTLPIPNDPSLIGISVFAQSLAFDPNTGGGSTSNRTTVTIQP